jgi:peroxiredoxin
VGPGAALIEASAVPNFLANHPLPPTERGTMARLESDPIDLAVACPDFRLPSAQGGSVALDDFAGVLVLGVFFYCNHCPYAQAIEERLIRLEIDYRDRGFRFVAISPNDARAYPEDSFEKMQTRAQQRNYGFPYLYDEDQSVARAFGAVCTPDLYVFDANRKLAYHGRLDDSPMEATKVRRHELREAVDAMLRGEPTPERQNPSIGCSIKWK